MPNDLTPLMAQYRAIKQKHPDCILLFRVGDFFETFYEDAVEVSSILNIALTTRDKKKENPVPLAGVPFHAAESYITKLLSAGKKVAVCEQVEDPSKAKGLVKREVVEILTPGTAMNPQLLADKEHNYLLCLYQDEQKAGIALIDVSTGELSCDEGSVDSIHHLLQGKNVKEIICNLPRESGSPDALLEALGNPFITQIDPDSFEKETTDKSLALQFGSKDDRRISTLRGLEKTAVGALLYHCQKLRGGFLPQVVSIGKLSELSFLGLDDETIGNLELLRPLRGGDPKATLIRVLDETLTPMGGREIREWIQKPLANAVEIEKRLEAVSEIYSNPSLHESISLALRSISDIRRLASRIAARKAIPREFHALRESLEKVPELIAALNECHSQLLRRLRGSLDDHGNLRDTIEKAIVAEPPGHLREGGVIRRGFSEELDTLISLSEEAKEWIANLERRERSETGISSLKVGYNKVFGYYIEVPRTHKQSVPSRYVTKQTLVNAERYYTQDLKDREQLILETEDKRIECEQRIFHELCDTVSEEISRLQRTSDAIAGIDVLLSLASVARKYGYTRPHVDDSNVLEIVGGRHPVLERVIKEPFVPNDILLDPENKCFALITGPNMSGKSTFLRQTALITIMAQMGSFVPARKARIGVIDKIFTRVGATDRLSRGQSTFLVEMRETANILDQMSDRSLILLDEIGRGTSTFDGLSIAWAVSEYILGGYKARPKTLFATHFHELTQLQRMFGHMMNLKITIREWEGGIIFLRKIVPGTSEKSYGLHAAKIAGLPPEVLKRAHQILESLELRRNLLSMGVRLDESNANQYDMFSQPPEKKTNTPSPSSTSLNAIKNMVKNFDIDNSTPLEALQLITELKKRLTD